MYEIRTTWHTLDVQSQNTGFPFINQSSMYYLKNSLYTLKWSKALLAWSILHHKLDVISFCLVFFPFTISFLFQNRGRHKEYVYLPLRPLHRLSTSHCGALSADQVLLHLGPWVHNCHQETRIPAALWPSQGWYWHRAVLFLCAHLSPVIHFVHLWDFTAVCEVWLIALSGPVRSVTLATSHMFPAALPLCHRQVLYFFSTLTWINFPLQLWIMPTEPFPLSPYSKFQFMIYQHAIFTKEAYLSLSH